MTKAALLFGFLKGEKINFQNKESQINGFKNEGFVKWHNTTQLSLSFYLGDHLYRVTLAIILRFEAFTVLIFLKKHHVVIKFNQLE